MPTYAEGVVEKATTHELSNADAPMLPSEVQDNGAVVQYNGVRMPNNGIEIQEEAERRISFFLSPIQGLTPHKDITLRDVYRYISGPYAQNRTRNLRSLADPKKAAEYKRKKFDYVTFSGVFQKRTDADLVAHSRLLCIDFDHLENLQEVRRILLADPHFETQLLFISPSGNGIKWVIGIDLQQASHEQWFQAVSNYLKFTYQLDADPACRNVSRACFLPHDPECYIAPRLLPELTNVLHENPEVETLMTNLGANNIIVEQLNPANQYDQL